MLIRKDSKYEPKTINDIIWGNAESRLRIEDIVSGAEALPLLRQISNSSLRSFRNR